MIFYENDAEETYIKSLVDCALKANGLSVLPIVNAVISNLSRFEPPVKEPVPEPKKVPLASKKPKKTKKKVTIVGE